ncbi:hypothetical protein INT47_001658 [Mucor saturninus]|uniref:SEC7 domain-containing protein n=1 Tax=Mucor saturninus TaxID=64648 RepID=A0A8H7RJU8_9FUNG|nr:hypothetical protein INT47_001658 [Mucor saturninus]
MEKSSTLLQKVPAVTPSRTISTASKHIPITIPAKLTQAQKEAALPFLTQEPPKPKTSTSKAKALSRFFKKLAKASPAKDCLKSSSSTDLKKKTEYKLTFVPIVKKNESTAPAKADTTEIVWYDSSISSTNATVMETSPVSDNTASEYAQRIWDEDTTVYSNLDHVVEWIGNGKEASNAILESYMSHFDFKGLKLEQAFRNLCSKLHLKGETQQIDRVLYQFSARFFQCNTNSIFGSIDVVHAIVYSLLLLNTDLHVAQGDYKKMSQVAFVKNTMNAISTGASSMLENMQSYPLQRTTTINSDVSTKSYDSYAKNFQTELKQMYMNIRYNQIANPSSSPIAIQNNRVSTAFKRSVGTIIWKNTRDSVVANNTACETTSISSAQSAAPSSVMQYQAVASHLQNTELPTSYTSNAPYYKEGMVVRKHLLEKANQKAKHRDWKECFMVIERSQLRMYKLDSTSYPKRSRSTPINVSDSASQVSATSEVSVVGGGNWMSHAQLIGAIDLKHTLANALPSGYSRQRQHAFTLQQSNGAVSVFQVGSAEQVHEWVSTCNYWAARESKEPLVGGISSMEYGWGLCLEALAEESNAIVHEWLAPACPTISSMLEESAQLEVLHKHVQELSAQLDQHRDVKPKMNIHFSAFPKYCARAMINYENKSHYLLHEIIKYQNYCNSIEKSLALQANLMASA